MTKVCLLQNALKDLTNTFLGPTDTQSLRSRMRDYARVGQRLFMQRVVIFGSGIALAAYYYDTTTALIFYAAIWLSELFDLRVFFLIRRPQIWNEKAIKSHLRYIYLGTVVSASVISLFCISVALQQGQVSHFMPLFLLFSASVFAAINNNQFLPVLALRLSIYMAAILFIPIYDLIVSGAPLRSELWLQFFTVLFVLSFVIECARSFLVGYVTNLRHVRQIEKEHEKSKAAYKAKTEFISTISHELRTPLTSIKGSLQLLESGVAGDLPEKAAPLLTIANRNSARLSELIEGILTFQESEAGRLTYDFQDLELKSLTTGVVDRMTSYAEGLGVQIEQPTGDQEYWVNADPERLEQVVTNILSNAVKFSHKDGSVRLRLEHVDGIVRLSISDDGIGIPADKSELIFEQFSQIDSSDERSYEGSGLGMSVSSAIIAGHGGKIDFTSEEGVGTTFFFELPAVARPDLEAADNSSKPPDADFAVASAS